MQTVQIVVKHIYMPNKKDLLDAGRVVTTLAVDDLFEVLVSSQGVKGVDKVIRKDDLVFNISSSIVQSPTADKATLSFTAQGEIKTVNLNGIINPTSTENLIPIIIEERATGSEIFAQENTYNQSYTGTNRHAGGVKVGDNIYCPPYSASQTLKINAVSKISEFIGSVYVGTNKWTRGVYMPSQNKIYFPHSGVGTTGRRNFLVLDLADETTSLLPYPTGAPDGIFGGVLHPNGNIYFMPFNNPTNQGQIVKIDSAGVPTAVGPVINWSVSQTFVTAVTQYDNFIYGIPRGVSASPGGIYKFDVISQTGSFITIPPAVTGKNFDFSDGVQYGNFYYASPLRSNNILKFDLINEVATLIETGTLPADAYAGASIIDNKIYFTPIAATGFLVLDPSDESINTLGTLTGFLGSIQADERTVFLPPWTSSRPADIIFSEPFFSPTNPEPYFSENNLVNIIGSTIRLASAGEDYEVIFTRSGANYITASVEKLKANGASTVYFNFVTSNAFV